MDKFRDGLFNGTVKMQGAGKERLFAAIFEYEVWSNCFFCVGSSCVLCKRSPGPLMPSDSSDVQLHHNDAGRFLQAANGWSFDTTNDRMSNKSSFSFSFSLTINTASRNTMSVECLLENWLATGQVHTSCGSISSDDLPSAESHSDKQSLSEWSSS